MGGFSKSFWAGWSEAGSDHDGRDDLSGDECAESVGCIAGCVEAAGGGGEREEGEEGGGSVGGVERVDVVVEVGYRRDDYPGSSEGRWPTKYY